MLAEETKLGRPVVLVVDEAQNLSPHTLEGIRMLTNFETTRSKLIQVVLAGQPQLAQILARPDLAQLRQRISTLCRIKPFTSLETRSYIQHRLKFAGYGGEELFTPEAFDRIAGASSGIPRVINTLSRTTADHR
jgi:type II secretory pathway predicted ATPase ExeA